jgi:glycosyltransferase involved in cell wall biosynthesis
MSKGLNVKFLGRIEENHLVKIYGITDFIVLLSRYDPFLLVALEAMASGAIPILSPTTGASEIVRHGENGYIIVDEGGFIELLETIDKIDLESIRRKARETALQYSWANIASKLTSEIISRIKVN